MEYSIIIIMVALLQYSYFGLRTGIARPKYGVLAPKVTGNETWERLFRIHQNTMEQLVVFIPALLAFAHYNSPKWAAVMGILFIITRQVYSYTYMKEPSKRMFPPGFFINVALVIGSLIGVAKQLMTATS